MPKITFAITAMEQQHLALALEQLSAIACGRLALAFEGMAGKQQFASGSDRVPKLLLAPMAPDHLQILLGAMADVEGELGWQGHPPATPCIPSQWQALLPTASPVVDGQSRSSVTLEVSHAVELRSLLQSFARLSVGDLTHLTSLIRANRVAVGPGFGYPRFTDSPRKDASCDRIDEIMRAVRFALGCPHPLTFHRIEAETGYPRDATLSVLDTLSGRLHLHLKKFRTPLP